MWEIVPSAIGLLGSVGVALVAFYTIPRRVKSELEGRYDEDLRKLRLGVYPKLWAATEPLAKYAREPPGYPTRGALDAISKAFRSWYFTEGGLYLSAEAREAYFQCQEALATVVTSDKWNERESTQVDEDTFNALREICSWLRTAITYDVGTRRRFSLAPGWVEADAAANKRAVEDDEAAKVNAELLAKALEQAWGPTTPAAA